MNVIGRKACAFGKFGKFGGRVAHHHLFVCMSSCLTPKYSLPFPNYEHDLALIIVGHGIGYIYIWPWKLTTLYMG
jgi:hypothetical protein